MCKGLAMGLRRDRGDPIAHKCDPIAVIGIRDGGNEG